MAAIIKTEPEGRQERKFVTREMSAKEIEHLIKIHPCLFRPLYVPRRVNNIYLDSFTLENYHENIDGNKRRLKVRIRWYGDMFSLLKKPVLELKIKNGDIGRKLHFPLVEFSLDKSFSYSFLQEKIFPQSGLPHWLMEKLKLYRPSLLNSYRRSYFLSADKKHRLTIDSDLTYFEINAQSNDFLHSIKDKETFILELKYDQSDDYTISEITQHFPLRLTKSSKYISGIDLFEIA